MNNGMLRGVAIAILEECLKNKESFRIVFKCKYVTKRKLKELEGYVKG